MTDEELKKLYSLTEDGVGEDDEEINSLLWRIRKRVAKNYPVDKPQPVEKKVEYIELFRPYFRTQSSYHQCAVSRYHGPHAFTGAHADLLFPDGRRPAGLDVYDDVL